MYVTKSEVMKGSSSFLVKSQPVISIGPLWKVSTVTYSRWLDEANCPIMDFVLYHKPLLPAMNCIAPRSQAPKVGKTIFASKLDHFAHFKEKIIWKIIIWKKKKPTKFCQPFSLALHKLVPHISLPRLDNNFFAFHVKQSYLRLKDMEIF